MRLKNEIEEMHYEAETLRSMALAAYEAIYNGCTWYKEFEGQLNAVFHLAHEHSENLKTLRDKAFELERSGGLKEGKQCRTENSPGNNTDYGKGVQPTAHKI